jgi:hypothetical protein
MTAAMKSSSVPFYLRNIPQPLPAPTSPIKESVAEIVARARRKIAQNWDKSMSLGILLRSYERTVLYQGAVYVSEGDYVQGYLYLYMFAEFVTSIVSANARFAITWIKQHPDRGKLPYKAQIQHITEVEAYTFT